MGAHEDEFGAHFSGVRSNIARHIPDRRLMDVPGRRYTLSFKLVGDALHVLFGVALIGQVCLAMNVRGSIATCVAPIKAGAVRAAQSR
jgi:hypothetical protein